MFNGGSSGGASPSIVCVPLVVTELAALPPSPVAFEGLGATLPPGDATPAVSEPGPTVIHLRTGELVVEVAAGAEGIELESAIPQTATPRAPTHSAPGWVAVILEISDDVIIRPGVTWRAINRTGRPAEALVVRVVPAVGPNGPAAGTPTADPWPGVLLARLVTAASLPAPV